MKQSCIEWTRHNWVKNVNPLRIVEEINVWPKYEMIYARNGTSSWERNAQHSKRFWGAHISVNRLEEVLINKKKIAIQFMF